MTIARGITGVSKMSSLQPGQTSGLASAPDSAADSFQNVLKGLISDSQKNAIPASLSSAINSEQLKLLVGALQIQMNSRLYNTLFSNGLESNILAKQAMQTYGAHLTPFVTPASNNSQQTPKKNPLTSAADLDRIIDEAAKKFDVDEHLIRSVIYAESNFNSQATSSKGAMGLMQLMPETAREMGVQNAYDARENVMGGTRYLKMLLDRYNGEVDLALAAYNWGMGNLEKNPHRLPQETINYVAKINSYYKEAQV